MVTEDNDSEFEGEETLSIEARDRLDKDHAPDEEKSSEEIYPDATVNIARDPVSAFQLKRKYDKTPPLLKLDPEFQRELVWNPKQQSELIESILMGIPLPLIYVKEDQQGVYIIVDGRQRLSTLFDFMNNGFKLQKLQVLKKLDGDSFDDLDQKQQGMIEDCPLTLHVIKPPTSDRVTFDLFDRVNRGGTRLNNQEMRNALYQGYSTEFLKRLSKSKSFKQATGDSVTSTRMKDRYLILRFLSFYLWRQENLTDISTGEKVEYRSDLEDFLGKAMKYINNEKNRETVDALPPMFEKTMDLCFSILGKDCFRLPKKNGKIRRPVNMALFEATGYFISQLFDLAENRPEIVKNKYTELLENRFADNEDGKKNFIKALTSTVDSNVSVFKRFELVEEKIKEIRDAE